MATKARQQYFADEISLQKQSREFSIVDDIQQKIDSVEEGAQVNVIETVKVNGTALIPDVDKAVNVEVPEVIDNLYTVDSNDALSAKQGKLLYDYIQNLQTIGRFLSNWDSATGLPITNPSESPYTYKAGDYYRVSNVATSPATNYKPDGSSYTIGVASTTVETLTVAVSDLYLYDGVDWILLSNSGGSIAIDTSLSTTSTNPVENRVITNALNGKHPGEISNVAPSNPIEGMLWYDTANDELKAYNGTSWQAEGTKMVVLEYGVSTWQDFINAYNENAIVYCKVSSGTSGYRMAFMAYTAGQGTPTEVEFQYYRSRSSHSTAANQLDEVYVYKLTNTGVWTTAQRATGAEMIAGTGIGITFNSSGATINNTGVTSFNGSTGAITYTAPVTSVNSNTGAVTVNEVPSGGTDGQVLSKVSGNIAWANPSGGDVVVSPDSGNELSTGVGLWLGTETDFSSISTPDANTLYIQYKSDGGGGGWTPGVNTLGYWKFNGDAKDSSGNGLDLTTTGNISYVTDNGISVLYMNGSIQNNTTKAYRNSVNSTLSETTCNIRVKTSGNGTSSSGNNKWVLFRTDWSNNGVAILTAGDDESYKGQFGGWQNQMKKLVPYNVYADGNRHNIVLTGTATNISLYVDGTNVMSETITGGQSSGTTTLYVGSNDDRYYGFNGYLSECIWEDKARTAQEISDYYNQTKGDYGIS